MFCTNCGQKMEDDANSCKGCGMNIAVPRLVPKMNYGRNREYFDGFKVPGGSIALLVIGSIVLIISIIATSSPRSGVEVFFITIGLILVLLGIIFLIITVSFNINLMTDEEIDKVAADYISENVRSMALKKLGINEEEQVITPKQFHGYYYKNIINSDWKYKRGNDNRDRSSHYSATIFFFSAEQIFCYQCIFSLLKEITHETTREFFYSDVVDASTRSDSTSLDNKDKIDFQEFVLTTTGGTEMCASIYDEKNIDEPIQEIKKLLRSKRLQHK